MSEKPRKPLCFDCKFGRCSLIQSLQVLSAEDVHNAMSQQPQEPREAWQIEDDDDTVQDDGPKEVSIYITHCYWQPPGMKCDNMEGPVEVPDVVECNQFAKRDDAE